VRPDAVRQWHTNHPLVGYLPEPDDAESERRWEAILPAMRHGGWGRGRSQLLLESPPVCRRGDGDDVFTFAAVTVEQSTDAIDVLVTDGPPQRAAWVSVGWTLPLPVKYLTTEQPARRL
jgi:hypothetical protein